MSAFVSGMRGAFLYLSKQPKLRKYVETSSDTSLLTSRFVAGMKLADGLNVVRELDQRGIRASLDHLGENVQTEAEAFRARDQYLAALREITSQRLPATISVKVTSLGLDISDELCRENVDTLVRAAQEGGTAVEFDMEDSSYTDRTLSLTTDMHRKYGAVRAVVQAYLYRTEADVQRLIEEGVSVRLCKGAYREPASAAWQHKEQVDRNYVRLMELLLDRGSYPAIATHDDAITGHCIQYVRSRGIKPERFEFEMLYGVRRKLQEQVLRRQFRLRLYVPYGEAWYPYFMRRLAERPANVMFLARSLASD